MVGSYVCLATGQLGRSRGRLTPGDVSDSCPSYHATDDVTGFCIHYHTAVVSYIKQEGRTKSFRVTWLTIRLLKFCDHKPILLVPVHLLGRCNVQANRLSQPGQMLPTEWEIDPELLHHVFNNRGGPWIDLFVMVKNKKCTQFVSRFPDPRAAFIDALSVPWNWMDTVYACHPNSHNQTQTVSSTKSIFN